MTARNCMNCCTHPSGSVVPFVLVIIYNALGRLRWFEHVEQKDNGDWVKHHMSIEIAGSGWREWQRKSWWDCQG